MAQSGAPLTRTPLRAGPVAESAPMFQSGPVMHYGSSGTPTPSQWVVQNQTKMVTHAEPLKERTAAETCAPYICEFVGTFMLTFTVATCGLSSSKEWLPSAVGAAVIVIVYSVGFVSGGHLNPAVSLAFMLSRKMDACKCIGYIIVQTAAGLLGGLFFELVFLTRAAGLKPVAPFTFTQAAIFEFLFTTMLCFVFLNVAGSTRNNPEHDKNQFFPLAIGFAVIAAGYAGGSISGASMNPAISFGLDATGVNIRWGLLYSLMELLGGILAALLFRICRSEDYQQRQFTQSGMAPVDELAAYSPSLGVRMFSEFVGTFFIATTFGLSVIMLSMSAAWAVGAALLSMVYALGNISGGHFNPAVTAAVCLSGRNKCSKQDVLSYWMAQLLGGVMAGTLMKYMHYHGPTQTLEFNLGGLSSGYHWGTIMTMEILFTFLLAYTVLAVATCDEYVVSSTRSRQNFYFALAIGFTMSVGVYAAGPVSGGYINPAAALAFATESVPNLTDNSQVAGWPVWTRWLLRGISLMCRYISFFGYWVLYFFFELIGAVLAALVFRVTHPAEYQEKKPTPISYVQYPVRGGEYA